MKPSPAFQFYPHDFLVGTAELTAEEVGAYIRLLCYQWVKNGLQKDDKKLMQLSGITDPYVLGNVVVKFGLCEDGMLRNARLEKVRACQQEFREKQSENGKKGGNPLFQKGKHNPYYNPKDNPLDNPKINSSSSSSSSNKEEKKALKKKPKESAYPGFPKFWCAYPEHKRINQAQAIEIWNILKPSEDLVEEMVISLNQWSASQEWLKDGGQWVPAPPKWLNDQRWLIKPSSAIAKKSYAGSNATLKTVDQL